MKTVNTFQGNPFEIDNARDLSRDQMVATFVPTQAFERLLSAKNHIVLGSRGSGKTALAKMLSHDHLSHLEEDFAKEAVQARSLIGIYLPTRLEWVGGLKNKPWQTERQKEEFFQWRLNVASCCAFLTTLQSCLKIYVTDRGERARLEAELVAQIGEAWLEDSVGCNTVDGLKAFVESVEYKRELQIARNRVVGHLRAQEEFAGLGFEADLFKPLRRAITLASRALQFPEQSAWLLLLDEAEFLEPMHHRILNSHLRAYSQNLFFKITTMPYCHYTLDTNTDVSLNVGHDFEYVYIDEDPVPYVGHTAQESHQFASALFNKRAEGSGRKYWGINMRNWLGASKLLDAKKADWGPESRNMGLLRKYANPATLRRAERYSADRAAFSDRIARKVHGALLLREAVEAEKGRGELDVYSGDAMAIRCSDGNPRRLIRIFNNLLLEAKWTPVRPGTVAVERMPPKVQTRILGAFSASTLNRVQSEEKCGPQLYEFLVAVGTYMRSALHERPLTTDQITSIRIDPQISDDHWLLIKKAVGLGLLFPNRNTNNPDEMPERRGNFHLGYVLAPHFRVLPRRGRAHRLSRILQAEKIDYTSGDTPSQKIFDFAKVREPDNAS